MNIMYSIYFKIGQISSAATSQSCDFFTSISYLSISLIYFIPRHVEEEHFSVLQWMMVKLLIHHRRQQINEEAKTNKFLLTHIHKLSTAFFVVFYFEFGVKLL